MKNEERKYNDFAEGECDLNLAKSLRDIKCSWWEYSFPRFDNKASNPTYIWQAQTYLWLWDKDEYYLDYCLVDAPEDVIQKKYWRKHRELCIEQDEVDDDLFAEVRSKMIHSHMPIEQRVKTFEIKRDEVSINKIPPRVLECRDYILTL